jgi:hypothetical protein
VVRYWRGTRRRQRRAVGMADPSSVAALVQKRLSMSDDGMRQRTEPQPPEDEDEPEGCGGETPRSLV